MKAFYPKEMKLIVDRYAQVRQPWITSALTTVYALFESFFIVMVYQPKLIICNGPGRKVIVQKQY